MAEAWSLAQMQGRSGAVSSRGRSREAGEATCGGDWTDDGLFLFIVKEETSREKTD